MIGYEFPIMMIGLILLLGLSICSHLAKKSKQPFYLKEKPEPDEKARLELCKRINEKVKSDPKKAMKAHSNKKN
jgi:hypothetical protein